MWLLHWLPLPVLATLGAGLGWLLHLLARSRRRVALRNLALCFPHWSLAQRQRLTRAHFMWLGRSFLERSERPVMWLVPHFVGLDVAAVATLLSQNHPAVSMYQQQSNPVIDEIIRKGRMRFGTNAEIFPRSDKALPLIRAIRKGRAFFNLPDMDFGARDAAFVPFFGVSAATLLAPSRMARALNMLVQPVVAEILPRGQGYLVRFGEPFTHFPTDDAVADTAAMNRWIEAEILRNPAQYLWVHKRFKTRPAGVGTVY